MMKVLTMTLCWSASEEIPRKTLLMLEPAPTKDKRKTKVGDFKNSHALEPPQKNMNQVNRPSQAHKKANTSRLGCHSAQKGLVMPKEAGTKITKPKGRKDCPSNSVNQDVGAEGQYSDDNWSTVDLKRRLDTKYKKAKSEKARPRGNDLRSNLNDKVHGRDLPNSDTERRIIENPLPENFKMSQIELYDGRIDLKTHLAKYNKMMQMARVSDDAKCLCFSLTLTKFVEDWWKCLPDPFILGRICNPSSGNISGGNFKRDPNQRCDYHGEVGHSTDDYKHLKDEIEMQGTINPPQGVGHPKVLGMKLPTLPAPPTLVAVTIVAPGPGNLYPLRLAPPPVNGNTMLMVREETPIAPGMETQAEAKTIHDDFKDELNYPCRDGTHAKRAGAGVMLVSP
uniref:Uncharacterized protein n=1 Tax=Cannabis sativa TaxID=3483 RepID=A0A803QC09_CANSA